MKKILSLIAITATLIGLTGCIDKQDGSMQKISSPISSMQM